MKTPHLHDGKARYIVALRPETRNTIGPSDLLTALESLPGGFFVVSGRGMRRMTVDLTPQGAERFKEKVSFASIRNYEAMSLLN